MSDISLAIEAGELATRRVAHFAQSMLVEGATVDIVAPALMEIACALVTTVHGRPAVAAMLRGLLAAEEQSSRPAGNA